MQSGWVRWIAYVLLASLVIVTSCQAMAGAALTAAATPAPVGPAAGPTAAGARP